LFFDDNDKVNLIYDSITDYKKINKDEHVKDLITFRGMNCKYDTADNVEVITSEILEIKSKNKNTIFNYTLIKNQQI
jgi:hypothetical protein